MIPTVLLIGLIGGLLWPSRAWMVVVGASVAWVVLLLASGAITSVRQVVAAGLVAALNAWLAVIMAGVVRSRIESRQDAG